MRGLRSGASSKVGLPRGTSGGVRPARGCRFFGEPSHNHYLFTIKTSNTLACVVTPPHHHHHHNPTKATPNRPKWLGRFSCSLHQRRLARALHRGVCVRVCVRQHLALSVPLGPLLSSLVMLLLVLEELLGDLSHEGVLGVGVRHERHDGEQHLGDGKGGAPVILEDVQADLALAVHVAVVDPRPEPQLRRLERVVRRESDVKEEHPALVGRVRGAQDRGDPLVQVVALGAGGAVVRGVQGDLRQLLLNPLSARRHRLPGGSRHVRSLSPSPTDRLDPCLRLCLALSHALLFPGLLFSRASDDRRPFTRTAISHRKHTKW
mmetsp:Transcript_7489/g.27143  ORF Transcript_7489/g.27143 Transcript_7489/m.27143 type:complete len:320 (-) Transcript_7489:12-971(-)